MSNKNRKIAGVAFLVILIIVGAILEVKKDGGHIGNALEGLGVLGLLGIAVDWIHTH
jgi:hypothetical protein